MNIKWFTVIAACFGVLVSMYTPNIFQCSRDCVVDCALFSFAEAGACYENCKCGFLTKIMAIRVPAPSKVSKRSQKIAELTMECPNGNAPTPQLAPKPNFEGKRPNVFVFLLDDQDEIISPYFDAMPFAKKLFLDNGTKFENAFAQTSVCCPSRCQILTGLMGHNVGVLANNGIHGGLQGFIRPYHFDKRVKDDKGRCINNEDRTLPLFLNQFAGYKTAIAGKYINGIEDPSNTLDHVPPGWYSMIICDLNIARTDASIPSNTMFYNGYGYIMSNWTEGAETVQYTYHGMGEDSYSTDVVRDRILEFIDRRRKNDTDPLFGFLCSTAPHFPITAAKRHQDKMEYWKNQFAKYVSSRPSYYNASSVETKARWLRESLPWRSQIHWFNEIEFGKRMGSLYAIDEMIEAVYKRMEALNEIDNTVFILTSDNGYNLGTQNVLMSNDVGSHMLIHKMAPYDESSRVPLYVSGPGWKKNDVVKDLVMLTDLAPTILDMAGLQVPQYMDGISLFPESRDQFETHEVVFMQYKEEKSAASYTSVVYDREVSDFARNTPAGFTADVPPFKAFRTKDILYTCYWLPTQLSFHVESNSDIFDLKPERINMKKIERDCELYDLKKDPYQLHNIYNQVDGSTKMTLNSFLDSLSKCSGKHCLSQKINVVLP